MRVELRNGEAATRWTQAARPFAQEKGQYLWYVLLKQSKPGEVVGPLMNMGREC